MIVKLNKSFIQYKFNIEILKSNGTTENKAFQFFCIDVLETPPIY